MINMGKEYLTLKSWVQELLSENRVVPLKGQIVEDQFEILYNKMYCKEAIV